MSYGVHRINRALGVSIRGQSVSQPLKTSMSIRTSLKLIGKLCDNQKLLLSLNLTLKPTRGILMTSAMKLTWRSIKRSMTNNRPWRAWPIGKKRWARAFSLASPFVIARPQLMTAPRANESKRTGVSVQCSRAKRSRVSGWLLAFEDVSLCSEHELLYSFLCSILRSLVLRIPLPPPEKCRDSATSHATTMVSLVHC